MDRTRSPSIFNQMSNNIIVHPGSNYAERDIIYKYIKTDTFDIVSRINQDVRLSHETIVLLFYFIPIAYELRCM